MSHGSHNPITRFPSSVPAQNLTDEGLLLKARRDPENRPMMGGIPLIAKLGQGGMGAVYYGYHPRLNLEVAVKVLPFHLADQNPDMIRRFFGEAQIAARVQSDHIVRVLDVNEETGVYYLVMEYVRGMSAAGVLKAIQKGEFVSDITPVATTAASGGVKALSTEAALAIVTGAARGLAAAHQSGIVHRDIKPDNIMIPRGQRTDPLIDPPLELRKAKLADLGLAKIDDGSSMGTMSQMAMGTPGYMAPEQVRDAKRATKQSDVFSLGATLYALLAGRMPFAGSGVGDILIKTVSAPHDPLIAIRPDVPAVVRELIDHCLAKDPADRYADGAALLEGLLAIGDLASLPTAPTRGVVGTGAGVAVGSTRGYAGSATPPPILPEAIPVTTPAQALAATVPTRPTPSRTGLIIAIVLVTLLLIVGGGAAAGYWFLIVVPEHDEYLRMVQASRQRFQEAKQDYADGKLSDEDYLTRLQGALAFVYDALNKDNRGIEAQQEQDEINAERDRISLKIDQAKTKAEAAFHELYNQGMLKEAAAKSEASEAAGIALWRQAGDLYSKAHDLRPQDSGPADGFARAKKKLDEYAARMNEDLQQQLSAAQSLEKSAADESDLAKQRQLWLDAGAAYEKIRAIAPDHPAIAPGVARVKAGLDDIKAREEGEVNMLVLAAQVAADRGSVAKDPARAMEDWSAAVNGFEKAVVLRPKDQAIRTKRDNAVKKKAQLENYFTLMQEGANQAHKFYRAHTIAEMKATAIACKKAVEDAAAIFSDDTTPGMLEAARSFSGQADQCERALTMMANDEQWNAAVLMDKVTTADANLAFAWFTWGQCLVQLDADQDPLDAEERDKIADKFNRATGIDPQYAEAWFAWGKMLEHAEPELDPGADPDETAGVALEHATVKYGKAAEADPKMTEAWLAWARGLTAGYSNGLAYFAVQKALALDPKNADAWVLAGTICNEMYCYEQACDNFEKAAGLAPERAVIWHDWAEALNETDRPAEAAVKMRKAADLAADTAEIQAEYKTRAASLDLAATLQKTQADEAKRLIALADAKVISADEYCTLLRDLRALRRLKEAGERAHAAIVAFPGSAAAWDLWAGILYDQNDYEGAAKKEETAVAVDGENKAYAEAWNTYKEEADGEATTRENFAGYAKALEADPHDVAALESWASDLYVLHNSDEAKVKIQRGLEMDPHNSALLQLQYQIQESQRVDARRGK